MQIPEHIRLVIALTENNSRHLTCEGRRAGAELELERALLDEARDGPSAALAEQIEVLTRRLGEADAELRRLESEHEVLETALANCNLAGSDPSGNAH